MSSLLESCRLDELGNFQDRLKQKLIMKLEYQYICQQKEGLCTNR